MFSALVEILVEIILGGTDFGLGLLFGIFRVFRVLIVVVGFLIIFLLFQLFRLGCWTFWRGRGTGPGGEDEIGRAI